MNDSTRRNAVHVDRTDEELDEWAEGFVDAVLGPLDDESGNHLHAQPPVEFAAQLNVLALHPSSGGPTSDVMASSTSSRPTRGMRTMACASTSGKTGRSKRSLDQPSGVLL